MGYMHINNLYKDITVLNFKEVYALEKIHGTSAHIKFEIRDDIPYLKYFSGGAKHDTFVELFNEEELIKLFTDLGYDNIVVFGEAYGGKMQGMKDTYGDKLKFIVFDVSINNTWLNVPNAEEIANKLGLEFVAYEKCDTSLETLDRERDRPSRQAVRNGIEKERMAEGIVIRPLEEMFKKNGARVICKHKREEFRETKTPRKIDPEKLRIIADAKKVADEWVTDMRLRHIVDKADCEFKMENIPIFIKLMIEDVKREGEGEIVWSKTVEKGIGSNTAKMIKKLIKDKLYEN